jgi:hypothetical protein
MRLATGLTLLTALATAPAWSQPPATGRYGARLCVQLGTAQPSCGPVDAQVLPGSRVLVRISDIVYQLKLRSSQAEVVMMHGAMQIDEFVASYEWEGSTLAFVDAEKSTRYELILRPAR